ncbi:MAG: CofH family radical SAM protein [Chlamydiales bacterium]|nr:CofH family radical SAM protein [Chlamydiales bacterium]
MTTLTTEADVLLDAMPIQSLKDIADAVIEGRRLTHEEGLFLYETEHAEAVRQLADYARAKKVGDTVYFATTLYIHPTNLCELSCPMCSYYAKPGWDTAWFLTPAQAEEKIKTYLHRNLTEIHIVGGLWRDCNLDYYQDLFTRIKNLDPNLHIKALTPVEYDFLAKLHGISIEEVFRRMMSWGLGSLPGGGAEILVEEIRKALAPQKITSDEYLAIHKIAHQMGLPSNITMLFGSVEDPHHMITHLCKVRELQDETNGFRTFVPLKYHEENNALGKRKKRLKSKDVNRVFAVSRLMLDNMRNLKVLWNYLGVEEAQEILRWGANDLSSTNLDEKIIVMAGGLESKMTRETMSQLILDTGRIPQEVHSGFDA